MLEQYLAASTEGRRWWLVDTPPAASAIVGMLSQARIWPGITTIHQAAEAVTRNVRSSNQLLGPAATRWIASEVASAARKRDRLGPLEQLADSPGLLAYLVSRFQALRMEGLTADQSTGLLRRSEGEQAGRVLAGLYRDYLGRLHRDQLLDEAGLLQAATEVVRDQPPPKLLVVDLLSELRGVQQSFVSALIDRAEVVLQVQPGTICDREDAQSLCGQRDCPPGLRQMRRFLFDDDAPRSDQSAGLAVVSGFGAQDTARRVARKVKRLLVEQESRPQEILVALPNLQSEGVRYYDALREQGVPAWLEATPRLIESPAVKAAIMLLDLLQGDWAFRDLLAVLSDRQLSELANLPAPAGFATATAAAEWFVRETQIPVGRRTLVRQAESLAALDNPPESLRRLAAAATAAKEVFRALANTLDMLPEAQSPMAWVDAIDQALRTLGAPGWFESENPADIAAGDVVEEAAAAIESLLHKRATSSPSISRGRMIELLRDWASHLRLPRPEQAEGRVRIVSFVTARALHAGHLIVAEAGESAFAGRESRSASSAMTMFWELGASAQQSLTFAYAALDESAQPLSPSPFVTDVERLFEAGALRTGNEPLLGSIAGMRPASSPRELRLQAVAAANDGRGEELARYGSTTLLDSLDVVYSRATGDSFGPWEGVLSGSAAHATLVSRYAADHLWSASQLELMATCPYKFFARQVLRLAPVGELALGVDYRRRGLLMHDALAESLSAIVETLPAGGTLQDVPAEELSEELARRIDSLGNTDKLPAHEAALLAIEARQAKDWAERYARQQQAFNQMGRWSDLEQPLTPELLEARFGPGRGAEGPEDRRSTDAPYELELPSGETLLMTGRIDRIDTARIGDQIVFAVIDYKTSREYGSTREKIESGKQLQPVLYALAAQQLFFQNDADPIAAGYWAVRKNGFVAPKEKDLRLATIDDGVVTPTSDWEEVVTQVRSRCEQLVREIRSGMFPMHNDDEQCGRQCEFRTICRVGQARSLGKTPPLEEASS